MLVGTQGVRMTIIRTEIRVTQVFSIGDEPSGDGLDMKRCVKVQETKPQGLFSNRAYFSIFHFFSFVTWIGMRHENLPLGINKVSFHLSVRLSILIALYLCLYIWTLFINSMPHVGGRREICQILSTQRSNNSINPSSWYTFYFLLCSSF